MVEAVVEFDYEAQQDDELSLTVGDIIVNIRRDDGGWWEGELGGRRGLFPDNFVREIKKEAKRDGGQTSMIRSELSNGRASPVSDSSVRPGRRGKDSPGSESDGADSRSETGSGEIQPKKVKGFGFGDIFKDQPIKLRPRSIDVDSEVNEKAASGAPESMKTEPDSKAKGREQCKVLFPYEAQNEDELSLKEGEIVNIITRDCADAGWWMGEIGGRQGVFPDNFVKLLELEKERPKKPPPPSAPSAKHNTEKKSEVKKVPPERPEHLPQRDQDRGEEGKFGEIPKPSLPSILPKKPLPPKTSSSSSSSQPPRRPERPPTLACESPKSEGGASTPDSAPDRSHDTDADLDAVVLSTEKLSHPTASRPRVTDRRPRSQIISTSSLSSIDMDPPVAEDRKDRRREEPETVTLKPLEVTLRKGLHNISVPDSKAPLPVKPSVLTPPNSSQRPVSPSSSSGLTPSPELRHSPLTPPTLEELRNQLRDLRSSVELLKSQHRQEMKHLSNALDEEKKIRLSLQMEVEHIKKNLSK
ncbi:SH3 domain-containing kinase-binding protein 1 isoform X4 [Labrus mixtus]|uniref:SH3 domain-containing kinase-binding protein 1 isoform X4 n=1 Tax=Labrus mixtus TaxID=508554 RepID=UPI0029C09288|nr:SH3 domain-containing kinase-binding protein 1 isoform X4 [Labrus mixtus]